MLRGVQGDGNRGRRDAVRRKTAQYLMKAEDLYNTHLATETTDERRWAVSERVFFIEADFASYYNKKRK